MSQSNGQVCVWRYTKPDTLYQPLYNQAQTPCEMPTLYLHLVQGAQMGGWA